MKTSIAALTAALLVAGCGSGPDQQPTQAPQAPERKPMALDPSPPMGSSDIDAIVNQHRSADAGAPAATGNTTGESKGK